MTLAVSMTRHDDDRAKSRSRRADRYSAREVLWDVTQLKAVRKCGRVSVRCDGSVAVRMTEGVAGFAGLATCGSVWSCPVCSAKIAARRQSEIEQAASFWEQAGGALAMGTFTVAHERTNSLPSVWDAISAGWHSITSGRAWKRNCETYGIEGWVKTVEVTHGANGWHVHVHVLFFLHHGLGAVERTFLADALLGRWRTGIAKHGFGASDRRGVRIDMCHGRDAARVLSDYLTKGTYTADGSAPHAVGLEMARHDLKSGRGGSSRTPFAILRDFYTNADVEDLELWKEWERGSKGRRQSAWSKGLRELCRLTREKTDEEIAAEELGTAADDVVVLPRETVKATTYGRAAMLPAAEHGGRDGLIAWLRERDLDYLDPLDRIRRT